MKELWAAIRTKLAADSTLVAMLGGASRIGKLQSPAAETTPSVTYGGWTSVDWPLDQATENEAPSEITALFVVVARDDSSATYGGDTLCEVIAARLKTILNGAALSNTSLHCFAAHYDGWQNPPAYDEELQEWRLDLRFRFQAVAK